MAGTKTTDKDWDATLTALELALAAAGVPVPLKAVKKLRDMLKRQMQDGLIKSELERNDALELIEEAIEPLAGAALEQGDDLDVLKRGQDQIVELLTQLRRQLGEGTDADAHPRELPTNSLRDEHLELVHKATLAAMNAEHAIRVSIIGSIAAGSENALETGVRALGEFQETYRPTKVLAGEEFSGACDDTNSALALAVSELSTAFACFEGPDFERLRLALAQIDSCKSEVLPALIRAAQIELGRG